jgi:pimeloyl-ACP methyl ester carboxylesterase
MLRRTRKLMLAALMAAVALAAGTLTATATPLAATPVAGPSADGSQPLPGYTVDNPALLPLTTPYGNTVVRQGVYRHAAYDLEVPPHWNGQLVMWAHPFQGTAPVLTLDTPEFGLRQLLADSGYAWAGSSFAETGFDVGSGVSSTHDLALYVSRLLPHQPSRTYLVGISMGSQVVARLLEQYPYFYAGALPMCGTLGDDRLFDYIADENLVAQDLAGVRSYPIPADYQSAVVPAIEDALGISNLAPGEQPRNALGRQFEAITIPRSGGERAGIEAAFSYWVGNGLFQLDFPDDGGSLFNNFMRLAQNAFTRYTPNQPVDVDRTVQRILPTDLADRLDPGLTEIPRVLGNPLVPVLTLHDTGDLLAPLSMEQIYARKVAAHGESGLLVQRVIRGADHCDFSPAEVAAAWTDLTRWVQGGPAARPAGDTVLNPRVLAAPDYGCRFTDPSAYGDPNYPTRTLFARCPG